VSALLFAQSDFSFSNAVRFIFQGQESVTGGLQIGGPELLGLLGRHMLLSGISLLASILVAVPIGLYLGHVRKAQFLAVGISNVGRAIPPLALIAFFIAFLGIGYANMAVVLALLAIPAILTSTYVAVTQVEPDTVDAARGMGLTEGAIIRNVELPLALPTIFSGIRIAAVTIVATATIAPFGSVDTLGTPIINANVYGSSGQLGAAIVVAVVTLLTSAALGALQRAVTPTGLKVNSAAGSRKRRGLLHALTRRTQTS